MTAIEQTPESVVITDTEGRILYVNPVFERVTGYSRAEVIGQNPRLLKSNRQDSAFYRQLWGKISAGEVWRGRFINKKKDGTLFTEDLSSLPFATRKAPSRTTLPSSVTSLMNWNWKFNTARHKRLQHRPAGRRRSP